jgi:hypothetical protein
MFRLAVWVGGIFAFLYVLFAQQSYGGSPVPWGDVAISALKVFVFIGGFVAVLTLPFARR